MEKRVLFFVMLYCLSLVAGYGQTQKDTVTVLQDSEISLGTWADSINLYFIQGGSWKKGTILTLANYVEALRIRAKGKVSEVGTVADTTSITAPVEGDLAVTPAGDTLLIRAASGWLLFYGGIVS